MHAQDTYALVIVCMSARKKAPVINLLMCTFELYMFIGVSMHAASSCLKLVLIPYCWSVALEKKKKKSLRQLGQMCSYDPDFIAMHGSYKVIPIRKIYMQPCTTNPDALVLISVPGTL